MAVNEYNQHLSGKAGNVSLDWKLIKAMVWVKTGAVQPLKPLAFCLLALASLTRAMATDKVRTERDLYVVCSADSQAGMRDCLARKADESVKALAAAQEAVAETLGKWDEERQYVIMPSATSCIQSSVSRLPFGATRVVRVVERRRGGQCVRNGQAGLRDGTQ